MSRQEQHHASDASTKNQTRSAILTPASDNFINPSDGAISGLKKRKRDGNTMEDLLKDNFVVKVSEATQVILPTNTDFPSHTQPPSLAKHELYNL